jgi:hypothetical protein
MHILFDQGTPVPLRRALKGHEVFTAAERGWSQLSNGDLLAEAAQSGVDLLITTDQNLRYQQNLMNRRIGIPVLRTTSWPRIREKVDLVLEAVAEFTTGDYREITF